MRVYIFVLRSISSLEIKREKLLENLLDETISKSTYIEKKSELDADLKEPYEQRQVLQNSINDKKQVIQRLGDFKRALETNENLTTFDKRVFESIVDRIIMGSKDEDGNIGPHSITFVYKTGFEDKLDVKKVYSYTYNDT